VKNAVVEASACTHILLYHDQVINHTPRPLNQTWKAPQKYFTAKSGQTESGRAI